MLSYSKIFSRAINKIDDPKELSLSENDLNEIYTERLNNIVGNPRIRKLFSTLVLDDEIQEMSFTLKFPIDDYSDENYVIKVLSLGMAIEWLEPQVNSVKYTSAMIGGKEEKKILDGHKDMMGKLDSMKIELQKLIRDYGYAFIPYSGES